MNLINLFQEQKMNKTHISEAFNYSQQFCLITLYISAASYFLRQNLLSIFKTITKFVMCISASIETKCLVIITICIVFGTILINRKVKVMQCINKKIPFNYLRATGVNIRPVGALNTLFNSVVYSVQTRKNKGMVA